jgi:hypothetical protein
VSAATLVVGIVLTLGPYSSGTAWLVQAKPATAAPSPTPAKPSPQTLDALLAPVALYPDQLLTQMLLSTKEPAKIQELSGWLVRNTELTGTALQRGAEAEGFEPSLVVLTMFPQVVNFMADNIDWTRELGQAFSADREGVLNSVQRLRAEAVKTGALKSTPQQTVETKTTTKGEQVIVIEPANPQVVYVPQYNPQVVYATPPATTTQTVVIKEEDNSAEAAAAGAIVGFAAGIAIGAAMDNDYYYGPYGWHGGGYMYNDSWNDFYDDREDAREDFYDHREDSREDWQDHREDIADERGDRSGTTQQQRTEAQQNRQTARGEGTGTTSQQRTEAQQNRQATRGEGTTATSQRATTGATAKTAGGSTSAATRGKSSGDRQAVSQRGGGSDAFSGYSSGGSERSASSRGRSSRASSGGGRSGGGGRRR